MRWKKHHICEKDYIWHPATCSCENGKYLASTIDNFVITCDEIIEKIKTVLTSLTEKIDCKTQNFYILLAFLFIAIGLLIYVSIYCYLIKYRAQHLLPFHDINNELKKFCVNNIL